MKRGALPPPPRAWSQNFSLAGFRPSAQPSVLSKTRHLQTSDVFQGLRQPLSSVVG